MFSLCGISRAAISVTRVEVFGNFANIVINEVIAINELKIVENKIELPSYVSKAGKVFPQVKFLTKEAEKTVIDAVLNNEPSGTQIKKITYKVSKMSPYNRKGSSLKAFAAVTFNGVIEIECKVMKSKQDGDYYIAWPARPPDREKGETRWQDQVKIINKKVKSIIEKDLIDSFSTAGSGKSFFTSAAVEVKQGVTEDPMTVTAVKVNKVSGKDGLIAKAEVDLNYSFRISDISVYNKQGQMLIEFPTYKTSKGKEYDQIKIFSRKLRAEIKKSIRTGKPSLVTFNKIGFEISKFEPFWKDSSLKYFCAVIINSAIEIECKILDSPTYDPFVGWPSSKEDGSYVDKIVPCNKNVKDTIEKALISKYKAKK